METSVTLTIDGIEVNVPPGTTILEAAEKIGIEIPRLCHQNELRPSGNCRICVVQVEGSRTLVGSCHTPAAQGMVVGTRTRRVLDARRATIELLLTSHTGSCVNDAEARECALHKLASDLEVGPPRFHVKKPRLHDPETGPYVLRDMSRCVLCRKCIRACAEVAHENVYAMAYRGFRSKVVVDFDLPLDKEACRDCGICIEYCPTSALRWPDGTKKRGAASGGGRKAGLSEENGRREEILNLLTSRQREDGSVTRKAMEEIAGDLKLTLSEVYGVATFYSFLSTKVRGTYVIRICKSLPCYLKEAPMLVESIERAIGIRPGQTTPDNRFSFELTNCIGACDQAPAMLVNDTVHGNLTPAKVVDILKSYAEL
jgi:NADH:ubiquinone oxidoreductase subunit E/NAD-dependent dihydropyrimidine dehydrogenase PreA subunit/ferredoxin